MNDTQKIKYTLKSSTMDFSIELVFIKKDFSLVNFDTDKKDWTRLEFHKCPHCTLKQDEYPFCPLAAAIDSIISKTHYLQSYDKVHARVELNNRTISANVTMQQALSSLLGLIIPSSGCPHTIYFRPMSRHHLPFADTEETIYRATTMFLLAQYFIHKHNGCIPTDFSHLDRIYNNVHTVNTQICKRLRDFCKNDSPLNAITILDMLTVSIHSAILHDLDKLEPYFSAFFKDIPPNG